MNFNPLKFRTGQWDVLVCVGTPLFLILGIGSAELVLSGRNEHESEERRAVLKQIPRLEQQVRETRDLLAPYMIPEGGADKAAELALVIGQASKQFKFTVYSSTVDKLPGEESDPWISYKVSLRGEGTFKAIVGLVDWLENSGHHFRIVTMSWKLKQYQPELVWEGECSLVVKSLRRKTAAATAVFTPERLAADSETLAVAASAVKAGMKYHPSPLPVQVLDSRGIFLEAEAPKVAPEPVGVLKLTGIVNEKKNPMIMTDKGVFGVGEETEGYTIEEIQADRVTVVSRSGRRETVLLYKSGE